VCDYSEKYLVSAKGTGLLPDCGRNQDKLLVYLSSLFLALLYPLHLTLYIASGSE